MPELTYDPTPADQPEFNEAEQEALKVGEARMAEEQQLLAGKFTDAEELEKAYIELQRKMGSGEQADEAVQTSEPEVEESDPFLNLINDARTQEDFDISSFKDMDPQDVAKAFLDSTSESTVVDLNQTDIDEIRGSVGGEENYSALMQWATESFPEELVQGFDQLVDQGNKYAIQLAVNGLMSMYQSENGVEPELITGRGAPDRADVFRSQAEVIQAMNDPRYDRDPAYRQDIFTKLERSNLDTY